MEQIENTGRNIAQSTERSRIGVNPFYVSPKSFKGQQGNNEFSESQIRIKLKSEIAISKQAKGVGKYQCDDGDTQEESCLTMANFNFYALVNIVIFILYVLGSTQPIPEPINIFHLFDIVGNVMAVVLVLIYFVKNLCRIGMVEIFHIYGIICSMAFYALDDRIFLPYLNAMRVFRLAFLVMVFKPQYLNGGIFKQLFKKVFKLIVSLLILVWIFSLIENFLIGGSGNFRCRETSIPVENYWPALNDQICGNRQCPEGTYCRNPSQFSMADYENGVTMDNRPNDMMISLDHQGTIFPANLYLISLNLWVEVTEIVFQVYNPLIMVLIIGLTVFFSRYVLSLVILSFFDYQRGLDNCRTQQEKRRKNQLDLEINVSILEIQNMSSSPTPFFLEDSILKEDTMLTFHIIKNAVIKIVWGTFYLSHIILVSMFGYSPDFKFNQTVGICLGVIFIIWSFYMAFWLYEGISRTLEPEERNYLFLEFPLYMVTFLDYIIRIAEGSYIFEVPSAITPLAHALIVVRLFYIMSNFGLEIGLAQKVRKLVSIAYGVLKFLPFLVAVIVISGLIAFFSYDFQQNDGNEYTAIQQINFALMALSQRSWIAGIQENIEDYMETFAATFRCGIFQLISLLTDLTFVPFVIGVIIAANTVTVKEVMEQRQQLRARRQSQIKASKAKVEDQPSENESMACLILSETNCLREAMTTLFESGRFQTAYFYFVSGYCIFVFLGPSLMEEGTYRGGAFILDLMFLITMLIEMVSKGVFGQGSYTQNRIAPTIHIFLTFLMGIIWLTPILPELLRVCQFSRVYIWCSLMPSSKKTIQDLSASFGTILRYLAIMLVLLLFFTIMMIIPQSEILSSEMASNPTQTIFLALKSGLIVLASRGWNWSDLIMDNRNLSAEAYKFIILISAFILEMTACYSLSSFLLSDLYRARIDNDIEQFPGESSRRIQQRKIQEEILLMKPEFDFQGQAKRNYIGFGQLFNNGCYKSALILIDLVALIVIFVLKYDQEDSLRTMACGIHFFCFVLQTIFFVCETAVHGTERPYFGMDLFLTIITIPGTFVVFIPTHQYSINSQEMRNFLYFINSLICIRLFRLLTRIKFLNSIMTQFSQISGVLSGIFILFFTTTVGLSIAIKDILSGYNSQFDGLASSLNSAFLGIYGGAIYKQLFSQEIPQAIGFILLFVVALLSLIFKNLLMTMIIYGLNQSETSDVAVFKRRVEKFPGKAWAKLDPQAKGFTSYRNILHFSKSFLPFFSISREVAKTYEDREKLFSMMRLPIYEYSDPDLDVGNEENPREMLRNRKNKDRLFVILFADVIYYLSRLSEVYEKGQKPYFRDLVFDDRFEQWKLRSYKAAPSGIKKTVLTSKQVLAVHRRLPKMRNFLYRIRQKIAFPPQTDKVKKI